jgi:hypothetical protein
MANRGCVPKGEVVQQGSHGDRACALVKFHQKLSAVLWNWESKKLPVGGVVVGAKVISRGKKKVKVYAHFEA